jgi:hemin uptake protein HemP
MDNVESSPAVTTQQPDDASDTPVVTPHWHSEELLKGSKEVLIQHGTETYRLRLTRQGKLILYK